MREILVYKPKQKGGGVALKMNFRPNEYAEGETTPVRKGGLFAEFAPQVGAVGDSAYAQFAWESGGGKVVVKLGMPDILGLLEAFNQLRNVQGVLAWEKRRLPVPLQNSKAMAPQWAISMFHKFGVGSTVLEWQFTETGSFFSASRQATKGGSPTRQSISLTLAEERLVVRYLERTLDEFITQGMR